MGSEGSGTAHPAGAAGHAPALPGGIRRRAALGALLTAALAGCGQAPAPPDAASLGITLSDPVTPACPADGAVRVVVDTLATDLEAPWDVAFLPDGSALVTERPGRIRHLTADGRLDPEPWAVLQGLAGNETGLMGIDTRTLDDGAVEVFVAATIDRSGPPGWTAPVRGVIRRIQRALGGASGEPRTLEILAFRLEPGATTLGEPRLRVSVVPAGSMHGGGALTFGPDGLLHLTNGDGLEPALAYDPASAAGKVLRFTPDGRPAPLNPGDPVPAVLRGIRNSQALGWHPVTGHPVLVDHGPSGLPHEDGRVGNDELNIAPYGADLGWPVAAGASEGGGLLSPAVEWTSSIAPGGLAVVDDLGGPWGRAALVTGLRDGILRRLPFDPADPSRILCQEPIIQRGYGRLRLVAVAPDGSVWVGTSNRDGRGGPRPGDDLLLRVRPVATPPAT